MQPQPTESSPERSLTSSPATPNTSIQHGFLPNHGDSHLGVFGGPHDLPSSRGDESQSPSRNAVYASNDSPTGRDDIAGRLKGLAEGTTDKPKPSAQLITEYENALLPAKKKKNSEGPEFRVVNRTSLTPDATNLEADFPNEVLVEIFAHLPPSTLAAVSLVCRRFHSLITTPHAWRAAFSRFFRGQDALAQSIPSALRTSIREESEELRSERRVFTRLTALASWRSEYVVRTRLLRSLSRGKPAQIASGGNNGRSSNSATPLIDYNSQLWTTIDNIHAVFSTGKSLRFIHGSAETGMANTSDAHTGKVDTTWGLSDPQALPQFVDLFPGDQQYGLGEGLLTGVPNSMDVSQPYGMIYGEGFPGGKAFFRPSELMRGSFLASSQAVGNPEAGIPTVVGAAEAICAVWIAKSNNVPLQSEGLVGMLTGSSAGIITSYSLGVDGIDASRISRGDITAKWVLSPGVPIIKIVVDESYNAKRKSKERIWAVCVNALGEVFYLTQIPERPILDRNTKMTPDVLENLAWETGRSVYWHLVEQTRRIAREDPYNTSEVNASYSPRSSSRGMKLSKEQLIAETHEIEKYLRYMPVHFRKVCEGWEMRRRLEVDFAGDDGHGAGEAIFVIKCGCEQDETPEIRRFTRCRSEQASREVYPLPKTPPNITNVPTMASLFGGGGSIEIPDSNKLAWSSKGPATPLRKSDVQNPLTEEWNTSILSLDGQSHEITATAIDLSTFALLTTWEDPLLTVGGMSSASSPTATPSVKEYSTAEIPGHRGRYIAVGTKTGSIFLWNMRSPQSERLSPLRVIHTESPEISCLAISSLYLVHGGNDGLVQAWDPLASTVQPIRTLNSRFASRARRRLVQAQASVQGVGINLFAAGAIIMDPDPTVLRGMATLGTRLRFFCYSSSAADQYSSKKRRLRRSNERGNNSTPDRFSSTGRGALMDYIATEQQELKLDKERRAREEARLRGRFGVGMGDMTEEEALRYAEMISRETFLKEDEERKLVSSSPVDPLEGSSFIPVRSAWSSSSSTPDESATEDNKKSFDSQPKAQASSGGQGQRKVYKSDDEFEQDIEEAIRLSLLDGVNGQGQSPKASSVGQYDFEIKYKPKSSKKNSQNGSSISGSSSNGGSPSVSVEVGGTLNKSTSSKQRKGKGKGKGNKYSATAASMSLQQENMNMNMSDVRPDDLELALRLSLMEVQGRENGEGNEEMMVEMSGVEERDGDHYDEDEFPALEAKDVGGKGKGRAF